MHYVCETKRTDWVKMNPANRGRKNLPAEVDMLRLWIDHGTTPTDDTYGYAVYCGDGLPADRYPFGYCATILRCKRFVQRTEE